MLPPSVKPDAIADLGDAFSGFFDPEWYTARYPDVVVSGLEPLKHFVHYGAAEGRDPNRYFNGAWYVSHYPDVMSSGQHPLLHYLMIGAAELRNPHPRFDAVYYADEHPEAAGNPLLYHIMHGVARGWLTEKPIAIRDYLPSGVASPTLPRGVVVDIIVPVYRGAAQTRRCITSVLADTDRPPGRVIVVDDRSPDAKLSAWLDGLASEGRIQLVRNRRNLGFVASVNIGIEVAGTDDVVLLNSDTEVASGWLARLGGHAYAAPRVASVSPFSNNATICGYPSIDASPRAFGHGVAYLDEACRAANGGRSVEVPTTVGFCMYIRRAALADVGQFDVDTFGRGYGEENDFCLRASARGWHHLLACDTFVFHEGAVSFGADAKLAERHAIELLNRRYPHYAGLVAKHIKDDPAGPFRFCLTTELFRRSNLPGILMLAHDLGGGVGRHVLELVEHVAGKANCLLLSATSRGAALSIPALPGHSQLVLPAERMPELVLVLQSARVTRAHIHHLMGMDLDAAALIHRLGVPFDVTVHDYFAICPQVNLLPWLQADYCGEPDAAGCNTCIANRPSFAARDITSWRRANAWQFIEAERVICPSEDTRTRMARYGFDRGAIVVPHEPVAAAPWKLSPPALPKGRALRVALIGVLASQKGAVSVMNVAAAADRRALSLHLIGYIEKELAGWLADRVDSTGEYKDAELPALLAKAKPHVAWFPAQWPETYSYTLTAAIDAGLPIVATRIGAFVERLEGRPLTWLVDPDATAEEWLGTFEKVRTELTRQRKLPAGRPRKATADFYRDQYIRPPSPHVSGPIDLRRKDRISVVVIPERFPTGPLTPCAYIRLLQPLDHPNIGGAWNIVIADAAEALHYRADIIVTHRYALADIEHAEALIRHCRDHGITLLYDIDDDLRRIPRDHPDAAQLRPRAKLVTHLISGADAVWVSTPALAHTLKDLRDDVRVVENGLDERLWSARPPPTPQREGPIRIVFMGTATHDADFALVESALERVLDAFGRHVSIDMIGISGRSEMPDWVNRVRLSVHATHSYPGFVNWFTQQHFDIGIAPLVGSTFSRAKSSLKALDYAAVGLPVLASDVEAYRGSLADGPAGWLLPDDQDAWFLALTRLVRDAPLRQRLGEAARAAYKSSTLAAQAPARRAAWLSLVSREQAAREAAAAE